jgi:acyl-CoA synthetase (NDP forming)
VKSGAPAAAVEGFLVAPMTGEKVELIVGTAEDPLFGPVLMLGLGGVLAEALEATAFRVCPINAREARDMIGEVRGLQKILAGFRGAPKADTNALVDVLVRVSEFAVAAKGDVASLDINPLAVLAEGRGAVALDALVVPKPPLAAREDAPQDGRLTAVG